MRRAFTLVAFVLGLGLGTAAEAGDPGTPVPLGVSPASGAASGELQLLGEGAGAEQVRLFLVPRKLENAGLTPRPKRVRLRVRERSYGRIIADVRRARAGVYDVVVRHRGGDQVVAGRYTVKAPTVESVVPHMGPGSRRGSLDARLVLTGRDFGARKVKVRIGKRRARVLAQDDSGANVAVPAKLSSGGHDVVVRAGPARTSLPCAAILSGEAAGPSPEPVQAKHTAWRFRWESGMWGETRKQGRANWIESIYDPVLETFSFHVNATTFEGKLPMTGFSLILTDGRQPVHGAADETAELFFDVGGETPVLTAYTYNGIHDKNSYRDGHLDAGVQAPDRIRSSLVHPGWVRSFTDEHLEDGSRTIGFVFDARPINDHAPAYPSNATRLPWQGMAFTDTVGLWFVMNVKVAPTYEDGWLIERGRGAHGWVDSNGYSTEAIEVGGFVSGTASDDELIGSAGDEELVGHAGDDVLEGKGGNDVLSGGTGDDLLLGATGNDVFRFDARPGADLVHGGSGADALVFSGGAQSVPTLMTLDLDGPPLIEVDDGALRLGPESSGTLQLPAGQRVQFTGIETIRW